MEVIYIDTFKFEKVGKKILNLLVESDRLSETIAYINKRKIKGITLNLYHGYSLQNLFFVKEVSKVIENIDVVQDNIHLDGIEELKALREIFLGGENKYPLDFSNFEKLELCNVGWHKNLLNLNSCKYLKSLVLSKYTFNVQTAHFILGLEQLERLAFIQSKITDLNFLNHFPSLNTLELRYVNSLKDISGLKYRADTLTRLELDHCKHIESYDIVKQLKELTFLNIVYSKELHDVYFLKELKKLKHFAFGGTNIVNGDLSPCIGIEHVGFLNKRHYSHTYEEIERINKIQ